MREKTSIDKVSLSAQLHRQGVSALKRYQQKVVGDGGLMRLLQYEMAVVVSGNLSGAVGYQLRKWLYRRLFRRVGQGVIFGRGMAIRHPGRIEIGDRVAIDDGVMLDASGAGEEGIKIGDDVIISRNCVVQGKTGPVVIGRRSDFGCNVLLTSGAGIYIGESALMAGNCYIGGGRYETDRLDVPMMDQGVYSRGPVIIEDDVWLGAGVVVLDGARIGRGAIVGAGALVTKELPAYSIAVGVPARAVGSRLGEQVMSKSVTSSAAE